jgi:hypothetical protein
MLKYQVQLICVLMVTACQCLQDKPQSKPKEHVYSVTQDIPNIPTNNYTAGKVKVSKDRLETNVSVNKLRNKTTVTGTEKQTASKRSDDEPLPIPIMVASPAVAVSVFIFICVAYKWHAFQLDAQAKELAAQLGAVECPSPCIPCSPCRNTRRLLPPSQPMQSSYPSHSDSDLLGARGKNSQSLSPMLLSPPRGSGSHRGSSWSAFSDHEVINNSPRRHSTLLL